MEHKYGDLVAVRVCQKRGWDFYTIEWRSFHADKSVEVTGVMFVVKGRNALYDPYSLDWEDHLAAGITYISERAPPVNE
jgi:hypothetical protein